jgi:hypothetical protein
MVTIGIQIGLMLSTDRAWDNLHPLKLLPYVMPIPLEQDMTSSRLGSINCAKRITWTVSTLSGTRTQRFITVLQYRHTNYARRSCGKYSYQLGTPIITKKGVTLQVKFFSSEKGWIPMKSARIANAVPVIEYA